MGGREGELKRGGIFFFDSFCFLTKQKKKYFSLSFDPASSLKQKKVPFLPPPPHHLFVCPAQLRERERV